MPVMQPCTVFDAYKPGCLLKLPLMLLADPEMDFSQAKMM